LPTDRAPKITILRFFMGSISQIAVKHPVSNPRWSPVVNEVLKIEQRW
jgi:hypothetical protein